MMYNLVYTITNIFATYTIYKFMKIFFDRFSVSKITMALSYIGYFIAITVIYFSVSIPIVMILSNLFLFFMLTFNYKSTLKQKLEAVILIYITLMTIENLFVLLSNYSNFSMIIDGNYSSVFGIIAIRIVSFAIVLIVSNFKSIRCGDSIPNSYWFSVFFVPTSSLILLIIFFNLSDISKNQALMVTIILFGINFSVFYLYDTVSENSKNRLRQILLERQNQYYNQQFELIKSSLTSMNTLKHDLKNHLFAIYTLLDEEDSNQAKEHISQMITVCEFDKKYANSGNLNVDSILNFKLNEAEKNDIIISLELSIPQQMNISSFDMAIIFGNLLDNAIYANQALPSGRYINVKVRFYKGRLIIRTENPYDGMLMKQDGKYLTTKEDKSKHGLGMESIYNILKKYDGELIADASDHIFKAQVFIYVD